MSKEENNPYVVISVKFTQKERFNKLKEELILSKKIPVNSTDNDAMNYILECAEELA